jgi:hypothetical protein
MTDGYDSALKVMKHILNVRVFRAIAGMGLHSRTQMEQQHAGPNYSRRSLFKQFLSKFCPQKWMPVGFCSKFVGFFCFLQMVEKGTRDNLQFVKDIAHFPASGLDEDCLTDMYTDKNRWAQSKLTHMLCVNRVLLLSQHY